MYCTTDIRFCCDGSAEEALPQFQAMLSDLRTMLRDRHPAVRADVEEDLTLDDLHEGFDSAKDFEGVE